MPAKAQARAPEPLEIHLPAGTPTAEDLATPEDRALMKRTDACLRITTDEELADAYRVMQSLKDRINAITKNPILARLLNSAKAVVDEIKAIRDGAAQPLIDRERLIRSEVSRFETARERERRRLEAENNAKQLAAAKPKVMPTKEVSTKTGDTFVFKPSTPTPITTIAKADKVEGTTTRTYYSAVLGVGRTKDNEPAVNVDEGLMALVKAVASGKAPLLLLQLNQREADKLADVYKEQLAIPGLLWKMEVKPVIGGRR